MSPLSSVARYGRDSHGASFAGLVSLVLRRDTRRQPQPIPLGAIRVGESGGDAVFAETRLGARRDAEGYAELQIQGPIVPGSPAGPLAPVSDGFVVTGLHAAPQGIDGASLRIKSDPELRRHGGIALALSELDELYQSFFGFLDAACLVLPDPVMGDRVFAAAMIRPGAPASLEALCGFLAERGVAPYKFPDRLLMVDAIPRDANGHVLRDEIVLRV